MGSVRSVSSVCVDGSDVSPSGAQLCCGKRRAEMNKPPRQNTEVFKQSSAPAHFRGARLPDGIVRDSLTVSVKATRYPPTVSAPDSTQQTLTYTSHPAEGGTYMVGRWGSVRSGSTALRLTAARPGGGRAGPIGSGSGRGLPALRRDVPPEGPECRRTGT